MESHPSLLLSEASFSSYQGFSKRQRACIATNMAAPQDVLDALEFKVNELLQRQSKIMERPLFSMTDEEAIQYAADRKELTELIERLLSLDGRAQFYPRNQ